MALITCIRALLFVLHSIRQNTEDTRIYDEVTEDQYKKIVGGRLQKDDFVVDDGVMGYTDNGLEDFGEDEADIEDEEYEMDRKKKGAFFLKPSGYISADVLNSSQRRRKPKKRRKANPRRPLQPSSHPRSKITGQ